MRCESGCFGQTLMRERLELSAVHCVKRDPKGHAPQRVLIINHNGYADPHY